MENPVRETTLKVVKKAKEVKINQEKIRELAKKWLKEKISALSWPKNFILFKLTGFCGIKINPPISSRFFLII